MKTVKIACSLLGIAGVCLGWPGCGNGAASASPEIETDTLIDLGKFPISRDTVFNVVYRNAGTEPWQRDRIETSCGPSAGSRRYGFGAFARTPDRSGALRAGGRFDCGGVRSACQDIGKRIRTEQIKASFLYRIYATAGRFGVGK